MASLPRRPLQFMLLVRRRTTIPTAVSQRLPKRVAIQVVAPPAERSCLHRRSGAHQTTVNGVTYYVSGSTYYEPVFSDGEVVYQVAHP